MRCSLTEHWVRAQTSLSPQRSTATSPPRLAIHQGWVLPLGAQWPRWLRLREVRDDEACGSRRQQVASIELTAVFSAESIDRPQPYFTFTTCLAYMQR